MDTLIKHAENGDRLCFECTEHIFRIDTPANKKAGGWHYRWASDAAATAMWAEDEQWQPKTSVGARPKGNWLQTEQTKAKYNGWIITKLKEHLCQL